jgi:cobalt-zinc-cadmium efflux system membrane fusion protein
MVSLSSETAPGRLFVGRVSDMGSGADESTRSVRVRVALLNRDGALRPGSFVRGYATTDVRRERVTVPVGALQEHTGKPTVYVAMDATGTFEVRHVRLGVHGPGWREISTGLKAGERIATGGTFYLKSEALKSSLSDGCCATGESATTGESGDTAQGTKA